MQADNPCPIRIRVLFFSTARERAGLAEEEFELPVSATVADALAELTARRPGLGPLAPSLLVAINEEWAPRSAALRHGDTLAVMPPVSGG